MCCFSGPVAYVAGTSIFARALPEGRQALVYSMSFAAEGDLAMILPLPVPPRSPEDAVRFVSLQGYEHFFADVSSAFPMLMVAARGGPQPESVDAFAGPLVVHDVGDFEASFVPTLADFDRLDARFKLAPEVWRQLPQYADWGFAVFKLKPKPRGFFGRFFARAPRKQTVHPMAFEFPRRDPRSVFFPTVHVHDGEVHDQAHFDHTLYCQPGELIASTFGWERSADDLGKRVDAERAAGLIDPDAPCFRTFLTGTFDNRDQELVPPQVSDASRLLRRGRCFELRLGAQSCYRDPHRAPHPNEAAWRDHAIKHVDLLGDRLAEELEGALGSGLALPLTDYDASLRVFRHRAGRIYSTHRAQHKSPKDGEHILVELDVSDERVEPQRVRVAFAEAPSVEQVLALQSALDGALARVELPGA